VVQELFRAAHTLKGSSATMGFEKMKTLTHEMENVLDKIRNGLLEYPGLLSMFFLSVWIV